MTKLSDAEKRQRQIKRLKKVQGVGGLVMISKFVGILLFIILGSLGFGHAYSYVTDFIYEKTENTLLRNILFVLAGQGISIPLILGTIGLASRNGISSKQFNNFLSVQPKIAAFLIANTVLDTKVIIPLTDKITDKLVPPMQFTKTNLFERILEIKEYKEKRSRIHLLVHMLVALMFAIPELYAFQQYNVHKRLKRFSKKRK